MKTGEVSDVLQSLSGILYFPPSSLPLMVFSWPWNVSSTQHNLHCWRRVLYLHILLETSQSSTPYCTFICNIPYKMHQNCLSKEKSTIFWFHNRKRFESSTLSFLKLHALSSNLSGNLISLGSIINCTVKNINAPSGFHMDFSVMMTIQKTGHDPLA